MAAQMPQVENEAESDEGLDDLAARTDGVDLDCSEIQGHAEYDVFVSKSVFDEWSEFLETHDDSELVERFVESRMGKRLHKEKSLISVDAMASEKTGIESMADDGERHFEVWAKIY